jgi:hypothetical protein
MGPLLPFFFFLSTYVMITVFGYLSLMQRLVFVHPLLACGHPYRQRMDGEE